MQTQPAGSLCRHRTYAANEDTFEEAGQVRAEEEVGKVLDRRRARKRNRVDPPFFEQPGDRLAVQFGFDCPVGIDRIHESAKIPKLCRQQLAGYLGAREEEAQSRYLLRSAAMAYDCRH